MGLDKCRNLMNWDWQLRMCGRMRKWERKKRLRRWELILRAVFMVIDCAQSPTCSFLLLEIYTCILYVYWWIRALYWVCYDNLQCTWFLQLYYVVKDLLHLNAFTRLLLDILRSEASTNHSFMLLLCYKMGIVWRKSILNGNNGLVPRLGPYTLLGFIW